MIRQNNINTVAFRLGEKVTLSGSSVYFLFKLTNPQTREQVFFTGADTSTSSSYWNEFNIIETGATSVNLSASTVSLKPAGWWEYEVHQQLSQTNLDPNLAEGIIQTGKIIVSGSTQPAGMKNIYTGQTAQRFVYNRNL
jgi:hypothetical protein